MTAYELLTGNITDIQNSLKEQMAILESIRGKGGETKILRQCGPDCRSEKLYREMILETINVLESTKKSFKSKQLEGLRKKLTAVLSETV